MQVDHDKGTIITGEVMNWNVTPEDASRIVFATEKGRIEKAIAENEALYDTSETANAEDNDRVRSEDLRLRTLLNELEANPPSMAMEGRVSRYLSTYEIGSGYILADGSWPE